MEIFIALVWIKLLHLLCGSNFHISPLFSGAKSLKYIGENFGHFINHVEPRVAFSHAEKHVWKWTLKRD
jgi:hypothetical protein